MLNKIISLRGKKGFTLVELIVVIAIIAVLTAVLVPLIGNYGNQATYTTLQDGAQTISNSINNACQSVSLGGTPMADTWVRGEKKSNGDFIVKTSEDNEKLKSSVESILKTTMPNGSCFYATLTGGAVESVIYSNTTDNAAFYSEVQIKKIDNFNEAYEATGKGAVGVSGEYKKDEAEIDEITNE